MAEISGGTINWDLSVANEKYNKALEDASSTADKVTKDIDKKFSTATKNISKSLEQVGADLQTVGKSMVAIGAAPTLALIGATKSAIDFESSFAGVRKTVELSEQGFVKLSHNLRDISKRAPVDVNDLNRVAELAGQLGISGVENLTKFTETITKFTTATGISGEVAATSFARIANVMQEPIENIDRMGSVVAQLGDSSAATEGEILEFSERIAGAGKIAGLSTANIFSIGAAMASVGVEAEAGGTAVQKVLISMYQAASGSTSAFIDNSKEIAKNSERVKDLELKLKGAQMQQSEFNDKTKASTKFLKETQIAKYKDEIGAATSELKGLSATHGQAAIQASSFAKVLGVTNQQFTEMFKKSPEKVFENFVLKLGQLSEKGEDAAGVLDELELGDQRLIRAFLSLSNAGQLLTDQITVGNEEWEDNNRLNAEAEKRYATTASQIQIAKNNFNDLGITIGSVVLPHINNLFKTLGPIVSKIATFAEQNPNLVAGILGVGAAIGVLGVALVAFGAVISSIGAIVGVFAGVTLNAFLLVAAGISGTGGLIALGTLLYLAWQNDWGGIREVVGSVVAWFQTYVMPVLTGVFNYIGSILKTLSQIFINVWNFIIMPLMINFVEGIKRDVVAPLTIAFGVITQLLNEMGVTWSDVWEGIKYVVFRIFEEIGRFIADRVNKIAAAINLLIDGANAIGKGVGGYTQIQSLPYLAKGAQDFSGGWAVVGERGPELVNLPGGSDVYSNNDSRGMMGGSSIEINIQNLTIRDKSDIESIGREIGFRVQTSPGYVENG